MSDYRITILGAGLAGCEAALWLAGKGVQVDLYEQKPVHFSPAHKSAGFAELICSNSLKAERLDSASGLLKEEMRRMGSQLLNAAETARVAAGGALAVDREGFARMVTESVLGHPNITMVPGEVTAIPEGNVVIASGPLTSDALADAIAEKLGGGHTLNFFDAAAPLVTFDSVDMDSGFFASRYDKGTPDYINCPMDREEYLAFWQELIHAQEAEVHGFEDKNVFEGCMPVEVMARRGEDTLRYGPLKPRGLKDPRTGKEPYAVVQLRKDNADGTIYNLVGFQTHLRFPEQKRVFSLIPGLENAEFMRYGVMHRNTFLDSPRLLDRYYADRRDPLVAFAGQMTGVEGYVESTASGYLAGVSMAAKDKNEPLPEFPRETAIGALAAYISDASVVSFQPMNVNFGILTPLDRRVKGKANKNLAIAQRSLALIDQMTGQEEAT